MKTWMKLAKLQMAFVLLLFLPGCWDYKEITYTMYATSLGIDYKDGEYTMYVQVLNFSNIGRSEVQTLEKKPIVVGKGKGKTLTEAAFQLYRSEQIPVFWGHVAAVVFTKEALQQIDFHELIDLITRYREIRYNIWSYATDNSIEELFNLSPFFGLSPYESILMSPMDTYRQFSDIKPVYLFRFLANYLEPGRTAALPILTYDKSTWMEGGKMSPQLKVQGEYYFYGDSFLGKLNVEQGIGKRYMERGMNRVPMTVYKDKRPLVTMVLEVDDYKVHHFVKKGKVTYNLDLKVNMFIDEMKADLSEEFILSEITKKMEEQIRSTFERGLQISADIYNLNDTVYRYDHQTWKTYIKGKPVKETMQLGEIRIKGKLFHSGKLKNRMD